MPKIKEKDLVLFATNLTKKKKKPDPNKAKENHELFLKNKIEKTHTVTKTVKKKTTKKQNKTKKTKKQRCCKICYC